MKYESEKTLEARLSSEVKKRGGIALKFTSQFHRGIPDRVVLLPYHTICFVEMKSTGEKPRAIQEAVISKLIQLGFKCWIIDSSEKLDAFLATMDRRLERVERAINETLKSNDI